jgi:hypothetical protein
MGHPYSICDLDLQLEGAAALRKRVGPPLSLMSPPALSNAISDTVLVNGILLALYGDKFRGVFRTRGIFDSGYVRGFPLTGSL